MKDRKNSLAFIYTLSCPLQCDYCCFPPETLGQDKFDPLRAMGIIEDAIALGTFKRLAFTGGEPFLCYDEIREILSKVDSPGLPKAIVTSAYWAETVEKARSLLKPLSLCGLDEIAITTDPSHLKFVSIDSVRHAALAALSIGMRVTIKASFWKTGMDIKSVLKLPESEHLSFYPAFVVPMGRARHHKVNWKDYGFKYPPSMSGGCREKQKGRGMDITIFPDGSVYPCCSCGFNLKSGLNGGNIYQTPLNEIVDQLWNNPFIRVMLEGGTDMIYKLCGKISPELLEMLPKDDEMCTICQICVGINTNRYLREALNPVLEYGVKILDRAHRLKMKGMMTHEGNKP